jgi:hypothetical protein
LLDDAMAKRRAEGPAKTVGGMPAPVIPVTGAAAAAVVAK